MAVGAVQTILVCAAGTVTQAPCPEGQAPVATQAYVLDASQAASIEAQNAPFDYAIASSLWGFSFTFVLSLYLVSKSSGTILNRIRK